MDIKKLIGETTEYDKKGASVLLRMVEEVH